MGSDLLSDEDNSNEGMEPEMELEMQEEEEDEWANPALRMDCMGSRRSQRPGKGQNTPYTSD